MTVNNISVQSVVNETSSPFPFSAIEPGSFTVSSNLIEYHFLYSLIEGVDPESPLSAKRPTLSDNLQLQLADQ